GPALNSHLTVAIRSELHAEADQHLVAAVVDALETRAGIQVRAAVIGVTVFHATEHVLRQLGIDTGADRVAVSGGGILTGDIRDLKARGCTTGRAVDQDIVGRSDTETGTQRAVHTMLDAGAGVVAVHAVVADIAFDAVHEVVRLPLPTGKD